MRSARIVIALAALLAPSLVPRTAGATPPGVAIFAVHTGLTMPVALRFAPDGRLFVLERDGRILVCADSGFASPVVWDTVASTGIIEQGLLGIDFHPDFPDSPYVYVFHCGLDPVNVVARLTDHGDHGSDYTRLFTIPRVSGFHQSGRIVFGPDRRLYVTSGDQQQSASAQDSSSPWGKLLRLTTMGDPAPDNPVPSSPVAAIGVRNSFGVCFDPESGSGYFTENGTGCDDELDRLALGLNYGWPTNEECGPQNHGTELPLYDFRETVAPTGCCVYRGAAFPELDGDLLMGSWGLRTLYRVAFHPGSRTLVDSVSVFHTWSGVYERVLDVTVGPDGTIWVATGEYSPPGTIWRFVPPGYAGVSEPGASPMVRMWPNPFVRSIVIEWPASLGVDRVEIDDVSGRAVRSWSRPDGRVTWDGRDRNGDVARPGIYFVRANGAGSGFERRIVRLVP